MSIETYNIQTDFNVANPSLTDLQAEIIADPAITPILTKIDALDNDVMCDFLTTLSAGEVTALDAVVAAHGGKPIKTDILETVMIATEEAKITSVNDWQSLGGVIVAPTTFDSDMTKLSGQITGQYRTKGAGAELNLLEDGPWNQQSAVELLNPAHSFSDSEDVWLPFAAKTNVTLRPGYWAYVINARKNTGDQLYLRYLTVSLVGVV